MRAHVDHWNKGVFMNLIMTHVFPGKILYQRNYYFNVRLLTTQCNWSYFIFFCLKNLKDFRNIELSTKVISEWPALDSGGFKDNPQNVDGFITLVSRYLFDRVMDNTEDVKKCHHAENKKDFRS